MSPADVALVVAAWLLTYLLHSTVLLGGTWALLARLRRIPLRWQDRLWKLALVGGLVTASVQLGLGVEPFGGRVLLAPPTQPVANGGANPGDASPSVSEPNIAHSRTDGFAARGATDRFFPEQQTTPTTGTASPAAGPPAAARLTSPRSPATERVPVPPAHGLLAAEISGRPWMAALWALWLAGAAVGLFAFARALVRLRAHLAGRVVLDDGPLRARLDALAKRAGVRGKIHLTASAHIAAPLTHGMLRREICVPVRALCDLSAPQQEAMLGHELGHAIRRDPAWLSLCWMLERVLLVQPLNRVARARLQQNAEMLCDDWAVHLTGRHLSLASCLTEVAQWVVGTPPALPAPGMAGAPLTQRVERLLAAPPREVVHRERWWLAIGLAGLAVVSSAAPGFAAALRSTPEPAPEPAAEPAPDAPERRPGPLRAAAAGHPALVHDVTTPEEAAAPAAHPLLAALEALDEELLFAMRELRDLKREVVDTGALDRFAARLDELEHSIRALAAQREAVQDLLPRALASLGDAH